MDSKRILIFAYHALIAELNQPIPPQSSRSHAVLLDDFWHQLDFMRTEGWKSMLPEELGTFDVLDPSRRFIATFDDGHHSDLLAAAALQARGYRGIFYIPCSHIDAKGFLSGAEIGNLARDGFAIGSHGLTHAPLTETPGDRITEDLRRARSTLEDLINREVIDLALPFGRYNNAVVAAATDAGFQRIMTSNIGLARVGSRLLSRMPVSAATTDADFRAMVSITPVGALLQRVTTAISSRLAAARN